MQNILKEIDLSDDDLAFLISKIMTFIQSRGIEIQFKDLSPVVESDVLPYSGERPAEAHHETAISDGKTLYLHDQLEEFGLAGRLYDLLHMGLGHVWQWSSTAASGLEFWGDIGWELGSVFHLGATEETLQFVYRYEKEGSCLALGNLDAILDAIEDRNNAWKQRMSSFLNDYLSTDLDYIMDYYRTGEVRDFMQGWKRNASPLPRIVPAFEIVPLRRENLCIPLIVK